MSVQVLMTFCFLLPNVVIASIRVTPTTLTTTLGEVTGVRKPVGDNKMVDVFYSIPFAKPPVGELRFKAPLPAEPWVGALDGTQKPNSCWQSIDTSFDQFPGVQMWNPNTPRNEDCLYLNIWRPVSTDNKPKSILVWIYGGGFFSGTTTLDVYDATQLSIRNDVIVVSIAYRLGYLGFLYFGNQDAPGNAGLMDQSLALKWVKDNAANLGGSSDSITIFGESAGAASVGFHLLSPLSRNYFNYAILESASPLADWAFRDNVTARHIALNLASAVSCSIQNISASINCLRSVDPQMLFDNQSLTSLNLEFRPVIDGHFIPDHPLKMVERGDIKNTSVLLGVNKNEGIYFNIYDFQNYLPLNGDGEISEYEFDIILPEYFNKDQLTSNLVKREYMKYYISSYTALLDDIKGDMSFKCPVINFANLLTQHGANVFLYSFEHRVSTNPWPEWTGVVHGYEIELVFGLPLETDSVYTDEEKALSMIIMKLWTNFAKTGNPNYNSPNQWPEYTTESKDYVVIDAAGLTVDHSLREDQCAILVNVSKLLQRTGDNASVTTEDANTTTGDGSPEADNASMTAYSAGLTADYTSVTVDSASVTEDACATTDDASVTVESESVTADNASATADDSSVTTYSAGVAADYASVTVDSASVTEDACATTDSTGVTSDYVIVTEDSASVTTYSAGVAADYASVTADGASATTYDAGATADSTGVTSDYVIVTEDSANVTADIAGVAADYAIATVESVRVTADSASVTVDEGSATPDRASIAADSAIATANESSATDDCESATADGTSATTDITNLTADDVNVTAERARVTADGETSRADYASMTADDTSAIIQGFHSLGQQP